MFSHARRIAELENRVQRLESDLCWIKNELSGLSKAARNSISPAERFWKLRLRFVEKPASMELEEDV